MQALLPLEHFNTRRSRREACMGHYSVASLKEEWQVSLGPKQTPPNEASAFAFVLTDFIKEERDAGAYQ
jgi:hypothetical protein